MVPDPPDGDGADHDESGETPAHDESGDASAHDRSSRGGADSDRSDERPEAGTLRRRIDPDPRTAEHDLLEIIATREGVAIDELPSLYTCVDHFVETLFETPPAAAAQVEVTFSYAGYRVTLDQSGLVTLRDVKSSMAGG